MQARLTAVSIRGGDHPRTVLKFVTTQPADVDRLGETVSTRGVEGVLRYCMLGGTVSQSKRCKRAIKVVNPDTAQGVADVTWTATMDEVDESWTHGVNDDFVLEWGDV